MNSRSRPNDTSIFGYLALINLLPVTVLEPDRLRLVLSGGAEFILPSNFHDLDKLVLASTAASVAIIVNMRRCLWLVCLLPALAAAFLLSPGEVLSLNKTAHALFAVAVLASTYVIVRESLLTPSGIISFLLTALFLHYYLNILDLQCIVVATLVMAMICLASLIREQNSELAKALGAKRLAKFFFSVSTVLVAITADGVYCISSARCRVGSR